MDPFRPSAVRPPARTVGIGALLAASILSAVIASVATVALVRPASVEQSERTATAITLPGATTPSASSSTEPSGGAGSSAAPPASGQASSAPSAAPGSSAAPSQSAAGVLPSASPSAVAGPVTDPNAVIVGVAARVSPAVVTITSDIAGNQYDPFAPPATGVGSGFVFGADGWILTNDHVIEGASTLTVAFKNGRELPARVIATDANADLAVVKVNATGLATVDIGTSKDLQVGQLLIAIGSPLGTFSDSVTSGILSATGRSITVGDAQTRRPRRMTNLLQTDAAINPGNSGGPLLDANGLVIGINSAVASSAEGIGFAIPIDAARSIMESSQKNG